MVAFRPDDDGETSSRFPKLRQRTALSSELLHGLSPEEFNAEAQKLADAAAMTPQVRARMKAQLVERLKTPVDMPSWGPDWIQHGERVAAPARKKPGTLSKILSRRDDKDSEDDEPQHPLSEGERDDVAVIMRNMEKSRQVAHYRPLYGLALILALAIALLAMFVDYQIIRGDVWTRALANEFMVVPASLQASVIFKSMQVLFAVLIVHFMLKISGVYGRNALITTGFVFAIVMIGCLGYLVAYNNMAGATSARLEQRDDNAPQQSTIDRLFTSDRTVDESGATPASARTANGPSSEYSLPLPKINQTSLANADSWFWLAFASVIFFIVTTVAALYLQTVENNVRNFHIAGDYRHRQRQFAQLHLLELAERRG
jgi:hypothetical protein